MSSLGIRLSPSYRHAMFLNVLRYIDTLNVDDIFPTRTDAGHHDRNGLISEGKRHLNGLR